MDRIEWTKVKGGAKYAAVEDRTFRPWLKDGLRHIRLPSGTILIKYSWIDEFLESFEVKQESSKVEVDKIVKETCEGLS